MAVLIQPSFAKGEISPSIYGRVDTALYQIALRTAYNMEVHPQGGISKRLGLFYLEPQKAHTYAGRLIPFQFKTDDQYVLEFGNLYMRVIRNDAHVLQSSTAKTITAVTRANPCVVTATSHGFTDGMEVFITGVVGMTELNGRRFIVDDATTHTFSLGLQIDETNVNSTNYTVYGSAGTVTKIYEIVTPFATAALASIKYVQTADVMYLTHKSHPVQKLTRTNHDAWTITAPTFRPQTTWPTEINFTLGTLGDRRARYTVTAVDKDESLAGIQAVTYANAINAITKANPCVVTTSAAHGYHSAVEVYLTSIGGMTQLNNRRFKIRVTSTTAFELVGEDSTNHTTYTSGGVSSPNFLQVNVANVTGISKAAAAVITLSPHTFAVGQTLVIDGVAGMTEINGRRIYVSAAVATTITAGNLDSTNFTTYTSGGSVWEENTAYVNLSWTDVPGAKRYNIYKYKGGVFGKIGETESNSFLDNNLFVDTSISPPVMTQPFDETGEYPGAVGIFQQRLCLGGSTDFPDQTDYSKTGALENFTLSIPQRADDAITVTLASEEVNEIRHFVPGSDLIVFTGAREFRVNSGPETGFAFDTLKQEPQSPWGSSHLRPIVAGNTILFTEENKATVRTLQYELVKDGYDGVDLSLPASHLTNTFSISAWAFAHSPDGRVYMVRSDGELLMLTFNAEQQVTAWTRGDTQGWFEDVCVLRHGEDELEDKVYFIVRRTIGGKTYRYIERLVGRGALDATAEADAGVGVGALVWNISGAGQITEGDTGTYTVSYTGATLAAGQEATVVVASAAGTATSAVDYTALSTTLTFTSGGATSQTVAVSTIEDTLVEGDEDFTVTLSSPNVGTLGTSSVFTEIIDDDTPAMSLSFVASATAIDAEAAIPGSVAAGDLMVTMDYARSGSPAAVAPRPSATNLLSTLSGGARVTAYYKVLTAADITAASIDGMNDADNYLLALFFRPSIAITTVTPSTPVSEVTNGNPVQQTISATAGSGSVIAVAGYFSKGVVDPRTASPSMTEVSAATSGYVKYVLYNTSPADHTVDMDDEGSDNALASFYLSVV